MQQASDSRNHVKSIKEEIPECAVTFGFVESDRNWREKTLKRKHKRGDGMEMFCGNADNFLPQIGVCVLNFLVACRRQQQPPA